MWCATRKGSKRLGIEPGEYARVERVDTKQNRDHHRARERRATDLRSAPLARCGDLPGERARVSAKASGCSSLRQPKSLQVANRELGTIEKINDAGDVQIRMDSGREVEFNIREHPHLDYGYALTSHSSQGQTADRVLIHIDTELGQQLVNSRTAYVSISRGRHDARIYTNDKTDLPYQLSRDVSHRTAIQPGEDTAQKIEPAQAQMQQPAQSQGQAQGMGV